VWIRLRGCRGVIAGTTHARLRREPSNTLREVVIQACWRYLRFARSTGIHYSTPIRSPDRVLTLFDIVGFFGVIAGLAVGARIGLHVGGLPGAILGAILGTVGTWLLGKLSFSALLWATGPHRRTTAELREMLRGQNYPYFHIVFAELAARGEDLSSELPTSLALLRSTDEDRRRHGWVILRTHFPEVARLVPDFDPFGSVDARGRALRSLPDVANQGLD
jgi:hypothetical protein